MRHISNCINSSLSKICAHASAIEKLSILLMQFIPDEMKKHCRVGNFDNGCLIIVVDDSTWASQLRFMLPEIRDNLRLKAKLYHLSSIKITISREEKILTKSKKSGNKKSTSPWRNILNSLHIPPG